MDAEAAARVMVAHLFQRSGRRAMSESELANAASLDLDWFPPKEARRVVAGLARAGYMQRTPDGDLEPVFDAHSVRVPLGFRPPAGFGASLPPPGSVKSGAAPELAAKADSDAAGPVEGPEAAGHGEGEPSPADGDLGGLLEGFAQASGEEVGVWVQRMERVVQESGDAFVPEVALLVAAAREGFDVAIEAARVQKRLEGRAG